MKITTDYADCGTDLLEITAAEYLGDWIIRLTFSDSTRREADFKPFLNRARHPAIRQYLNEQKFRQFNIVDGNLNWHDYELIFPLEDLHEGRML